MPGEDTTHTLRLFEEEDAAPSAANSGPASATADAEATAQKAAEDWWASLTQMSTAREKDEASRAAAAEQRARERRKRRAVWTEGTSLDGGDSDSDGSKSKQKCSKAMNNEFDEGLDEFRPADGTTYEDLEDFHNISRHGLASREELAARVAADQCLPDKETIGNSDLPTNCPVLEFRYGGLVAANSDSGDSAAEEMTETTTGHPADSQIMEANLAKQFQIGMKHAENENERLGLGAV
eukprot:TRINITY_DN19322_c0_g1_i1.p1 TRINITY_DN19322_c0_g1~~TRINITY_DN19322_c0_g1_i1.p1  ORF type:complete len:238 (-),score=59.49 TRINITY_DN19322_c0_g1_i1:250-963(-)